MDVVFSGVVLGRKLFRDLNRVGIGTWPCSGCLLSWICFCLSALLATALLISGGAIPARRYKLFVFVGLRQPVMARQLAFRAGSIFLACGDRSQAGHAYSAAEKQRATAVERSVTGFAPHLMLVSLLRMLLRVQTFDLVFSTCALNVRLLSRVTPR